MDNNSKPRSMVVGVIIALIIGGIVGGLIGHASASKQTTSSTSMDQTMSDGSAMMSDGSGKAADLRVAMNNLFTEHVDLALNATRSGYDGKADFSAAAKTLDDNSVAISKAIGSVYGADAEAHFLANWRDHIGFFVDYTVATKKGDKAGQDKAVQNLGGYIDAASDFLSKANPNLPHDTVKSLITEHVMQLKSAVDAYAAGDYTKAYSLQAEARTHMGMMATTIAGAIVKQFPDKFK